MEKVTSQDRQTGQLDGGSGWGTDVVSDVVRGHPCKVFSRRRRALAELLTDVGRWRSRICLVQGDRRITYDEFLSGVDRLAMELEIRGVTPSGRVLLVGRNCWEWLSVFWAIARLDAVPVLGNAWWSKEELEYATQLVAPQLVIADELRLPLIPNGYEILSFDDVAIKLGMNGFGSPSPAKSTREDDPALVLFTSGTTGFPKATILSHRAVVANQQNLFAAIGRMPDRLRTDADGRVRLVTGPLFHVGAVSSMITSLLTGATLVFLTRGFDAGEVLDLIERERVTTWGAVPTMLKRVLAHPRLATADTSSLRSIGLGGSPADPALVEQAVSAFPNVRQGAQVGWGLTESGGYLTLGYGPEVAEHRGTVGRPLPTVELRVDSDPEGELFARSPTVMNGYWGVDDDGTIDADGWLRTGDIGRIDHDGYVYITGRSKDVIIRGGENVAAAHVEACLAQHSAVSEVAVVGLAHEDLGEEVGAVLVTHDNAPIDPEELRQFCRERLAHFEVPSRWWLREKPLPINAVGKIDKPRLREEWIAYDGNP